MIKMPFYNLWMDNMFYVYAAAFAASLAFAVYAAKRWLELKNACLPPVQEELPGTEELPVPEEWPDKPPAETAGTPGPEQEASMSPAEAATGPAQDLPAPQTPEDSAARNVAELLSLAQKEAADKTLPPAARPGPKHDDADKTLVVPNIGELVSAATGTEEELPAPPPAEEPSPSQAGEFVKGIYKSMAGINARIGSIEEALAKGAGKDNFTVKFLEGLLEDLDSIEKEKVKARIEYLLSDLKGDGRNGK